MKILSRLEAGGLDELGRWVRVGRKACSLPAAQHSRTAHCGAEKVHDAPLEWRAPGKEHERVCKVTPIVPATLLRLVGPGYLEGPGLRICIVAKLVFGMIQSLDGYVDHMAFGPGPTPFRHFIEQARGQAGSLYGRRLYEIMAYWDEDHPEWDAARRDFAAAWRSQPKWVVSRSSKPVGPNATLVGDDIEAAVRGLKDRLVGEIQVGGPDLARSLSDFGLIDGYRLYLHTVVLSGGTQFFAGPRPPLRLVANDLIADGAVRLTYVPA